MNKLALSDDILLKIAIKEKNIKPIPPIINPLLCKPDPIRLALSASLVQIASPEDGSAKAGDTKATQQKATKKQNRLNLFINPLLITAIHRN